MKVPLGIVLTVAGAAMLLPACGDGDEGDTITTPAGLTASDRQRIKALLVRVETTSDPRHCIEDYTADLVQRGGGLARCRKLEAAGRQPDSIDVTGVMGTTGERATAHLVAHGGSFDGDGATAELIYENGRWKLDAFSLDR